MKTEKNLTGYPSIDKPWLKYYSEEAITGDVPHMTMYQYLVNNNRDRLSDEAIDYFGKKITYSRLFGNIHKTASALASCGVKKGDVVTIMSLDTPETIYCIYALNYLGAIANMVYLSLSVDEIIETLKITKSKILVALDIVGEKIKKIEEILPVDKIVILHIQDSMPLFMKKIYEIKNTSVQFQTAINFQDFVKNEVNESTSMEVKYEKNMPAIIVYTSGTTGKPKGVVLSNDNFNTIAYQYFYSGIEFEKGDTMMSFMPPFLAIGFSLNIHMPLSLGIKLILCVNPEPTNVTKMYLRTKPNHFVAAPSNILHIIDNVSGNMEYCKSFCGGGESMTLEQVKKVNMVLAKLGSKARYITGYGMSEFAATVTTSVNQAYKMDSLGIPLAKTMIKIVGIDSLEELPYNEDGEMCFCTPSQMLFYLNDEESTKNTARVHEDGYTWIHTGDLGCVDENGFVYFKGRLKRIYMTKGADGTLYKIFPARVEELLMNNSQLGKCAVLVQDDDEILHKMIAYITVKENVEDIDKLIENIDKYCKDNLPEHSVPVKYVLVNEMPLTQSGKIDYRKLEDENLFC